MKVLLVHNYYRGKSPGGEDVVVNAERDLLRQAGHTVRSYTRSNDEMDERSWYDRARVASGLCGLSRTPRDIKRLLRADPPDIVHVHNTFPLVGDSVFDACREFRVPTIQTIHSFRPSCIATTHYRAGALCEACCAGSLQAGVRWSCYRGSRLASQLIASVQTRSTQRHRAGLGADRYLLLSHFAARRLAGTAFPTDRVRVRANFVSMDPMRVSTASLPSNRYAVFTGKVAREKGVRALLAAWQQVADIPLRVIGDGPELIQMRSEALRQGLPIEFLGMLPRAETLDVVRGATLQVVPSEWFEGMPLVILEAWALRVPLVVARIGGCAELIGSDERGLGFAVGDPNDLAQKVRRLWGEPALAERFAEAGYQRYREQHTPAVGLKTLLTHYRETIESYAG